MALIARRKTQPAVVVSDIAITAAAAPVPIEYWGRKNSSNFTGMGAKTSFQEEAWEAVEQIGELRAAIEWKRALISRFRLVASDVDPITGKPTGETKSKIAQDIVQRIAGGLSGQSQMLGRLSVLLQIPGEAFLAVIYPNGGKTEEWHVVSGEEIQSRGTQQFLILPDGTQYPMNPKTDSLTRIWNQHPRRSWEADSALRAALPICREIIRMTQNIEGAGKSRQAGNGLLIIPEEISMPTSYAPTAAPDPDAPELPAAPPPPVQSVSAADLQSAIMTTMGTAIKDPTSAEALVPIVLQVSGEYVDKVRHLTFANEVMATSVETREKAVKRLAMALDLPAEVVTGFGDVNHWGAFQIEDMAIRWHCSDDVETIVNALTEYLLKPMLDRAKSKDEVVVWYDLTDVENDEGEDAVTDAAFGFGVLNGPAYLREKGFEEDDGYAYTKEGWADWARDAARRDFNALEKVKSLIPEIKDVIPDPQGGPGGGASAPTAAKDESEPAEKPKNVPDSAAKPPPPNPGAPEKPAPGEQSTPEKP